MSNTGPWAEATTAVVQVKYYHFPSTGSGRGGGQRACPECNRRVAMRREGVVYYLHGDHLGSTSLATTAAGSLHSRQLFYPYGETRYAAGPLPTDFGFTGQRNESTIGLYDYHARWYDPALGR